MTADSSSENFPNCQTLLEAMQAARAQGLDSGTIQVTKADLQGAIQFDGNKVVHAAIANTTRTGAEALNILATLEGITCSYSMKATGSESSRQAAYLLERINTVAGNALPPQRSQPEGEIGSVVAFSTTDTAIKDALVRKQLRDQGERPRGLVKKDAQQTRSQGTQTPFDAEALYMGVPHYDIGQRVVAEAGFSLAFDGVMPAVSLHDKLSKCKDLFDALLTVTSLGLRAGSIVVSADGITGDVEFAQGKVIAAGIVGADLQSNEALSVIASLSPASCRYVSPAEYATNKQPETEPSFFRETFTGIQPIQNADAQQNSLNSGATTYGEYEFLKHQQPPLHPIAAEQTRDAGENKTFDIPLPSSATNRDELRKIAARVGLDTGSKIAASAGFGTDFNGPRLTDFRQYSMRALQQGETIAVDTQQGKKPERSRKAVTIALGAAVFVLCLGIVIIPAQFAQVSDTSKNEAMRREQMSKLVDDALDSADSPAANQQTLAPVQAPATSWQPEPGTISGDKANKLDPSHSREFALANKRETLPELERLIREYMAKKKFRFARDLAGAGMRSPVATPEEKRRFWELFKQCIYK